jgi:hypothetical protein
MNHNISVAGGVTPAEAACRLVVRKDKAPGEVLQFVISGIEMGQQVVVVAGPTCLKDLASAVTESGLRADTLIRNSRLIFLTAPDCLSQLSDPEKILQRGPLRRTVSVMRWVTDWSWAYSNGTPPAKIFDDQRRVHDFARALNALSLCTVHCERAERSSLLAMLADHRRAMKPHHMPAEIPLPLTKPPALVLKARAKAAD